jgi:diaminopimelate epimerase
MISATVKFIKAQGIGNDFVILDDMADPLPEDFDFAAAAQRLCARHFHIGGDGLLLLTIPDDDARAHGAAIRMRMWNPDGTEDMCGNGLRCIVRLAHERGHIDSDSTVVQTLAGLRQATVIDQQQIRVAMGLPHFDWLAIPMQPIQGKAMPVEYELPLRNIALAHVTTLSTGSTHTVIFIDDHIEDGTFERFSPQIEHHPWFPERTTVLWTTVTGENRLRVRIWERGVGETLACGTGACAVAVAARVTGRCDGSVEVTSSGGTLSIDWQPDAEIQMTGPAEIVFEGETSV